MDKHDLINGAIQLIGAGFTWRSALQLHRDRCIRGVYWPSTAFFTLWGGWNLVYYPHLQQWASLAGGVLLVTGNFAWCIGALRIFYREGLDAIAAPHIHREP